MNTTATVQYGDLGTSQKIRRCENGQNVFEVSLSLELADHLIFRTDLSVQRSKTDNSVGLRNRYHAYR